jgi:hypothetical protein
MPFDVRKFVIYKEEIVQEGGRALETPVTLVAATAVIANPWAGRFVEDLRPEQLDGCADLGRRLGARVIQELGSPERVEAYGKAAIVGTGGDIEHAAAVIHNLRFGNAYRAAVGADSYLSFTNKRGPAGCSLQIPMKHVRQGGLRSHFITLECFVPDAPGEREILVAVGASTGSRPHARIGDREIDKVELAGHPEGAPA